MAEISFIHKGYGLPDWMVEPGDIDTSSKTPAEQIAEAFNQEDCFFGPTGDLVVHDPQTRAVFLHYRAATDSVRLTYTCKRHGDQVSNTVEMTREKYLSERALNEKYSVARSLDDQAAIAVTVEPDIIDDNTIGILTTVEELTVGPLDEVRTITSYRKVGKSRVKRKTRVIFKDDARGFSGGELHQLYGGKSSGASATAGTLFDPARYRWPRR